MLANVGEAWSAFLDFGAIPDVYIKVRTRLSDRSGGVQIVYRMYRIVWVDGISADELYTVGYSMPIWGTATGEFHPLEPVYYRIKRGESHD